ncbi:ankyrin repeat domain-containing protein [Spiroplasma endosymbiont of Polydrusus pterygomalis]|uniref:ankyrin repeat domain-containing protein n=1 Tax=Spiroplasma endosymbiont of Polydrusus pterygomalis TaxID=3139327 RepID=UPI003CCB1816
MLNMKIQNNIISLLKTVNFNELKDYDYHILILAIENNCIDVVNYLIANNINVNYFNETVLMIANRNHHIRIVKIINQVNRLKDKNLLNSKKNNK